MENEIETVPTENEVIEPQGTTEAPATGSPELDESESTVEPTVSVEELQRQIETERKERQKIEMERNQLKNKQEEERKKALEDQGNWKQIAEEREAELEAIRAEAEAKEQLDEANKLRDTIIKKYPNETVRKAAQALVDANPYNLVWGSDVQTEDQATEQINAQLDRMASSLGVTQDQTEDTDNEPTVQPNNPASDGGEVTLDKLKNMTAEEMKKFLPTADPR